MSLKNKFGTNKQAEVDGAWVEVCRNDDGSICRVKIRRSGRRNAAYLKALEKAAKPYKNIGLDNLDAETDAKIMRNVLAEAVIVGWENVQLVDGENLEFSRENVLCVLEELPDLQDFISARAADIATFREAQLEADAKN